jgi:heme/copper-type cytochrome/quinol oxidase subunit 1
MSKALIWIKDEFLHVLPAVIFFFVAFIVINFTTELMLRKHGIAFATVPAIALGALIAGKVLLVTSCRGYALFLCGL